MIKKSNIEPNKGYINLSFCEIQLNDMKVLIERPDTTASMETDGHSIEFPLKLYEEEDRDRESIANVRVVINNIGLLTINHDVMDRCFKTRI
jgi:hypothetical protein